MNPNSNTPPDADATPTLPILAGKKGLIVGIANDQSIAYGCAQVMHKLGATLAITYFNAKAEPHVRPLAEQLEADLILPLDVEQPGQLEAVFAQLEQRWGKLDFVLHAIAFAPAADLHGRIVDSSAAGFARAMDVSCHSFLRMAKLAEPLMTGGGTLVTMSYYGAQKVIDNYGIMGPVKAALESSVRYLAAELGPPASACMRCRPARSRRGRPRALATLSNCSMTPPAAPPSTSWSPSPTLARSPPCCAATRPAR